MSYATPARGLPPQDAKMESTEVFKDAYAVIPRSVMTDIVASNLPFWDKTRAWIIARPMTGFAETFAQYIVEVAPDGGSDSPEPDASAQAVLFVVEGQIDLWINGNSHQLNAGGYAYIPAGAKWRVKNTSNTTATFHWIRKSYEMVDGINPPEAFVTSDQAVAPTEMPDCDGVWATTRFVDPNDMRYDMHVNIVTFQKGGLIPFLETHVMEHGLYVLQGEADYKLNEDWVHVVAGDFMWLRAFCPQACIATSDEPFRYLLYKDVNRHPKLKL